jgi:hypothetical protein
MRTKVTISILIVLLVIAFHYGVPLKAYAMANRMDDALKNANKELGNLFENSSSSTNKKNTMSAYNHTTSKTASGS